MSAGNKVLRDIVTDLEAVLNKWRNVPCVLSY